MQLDAEKIQCSDKPVEDDPDAPTTPEACKDRMEEVNKAVKDVSFHQREQTSVKSGWAGLGSARTRRFSGSSSK